MPHTYLFGDYLRECQPIVLFGHYLVVGQAHNLVSEVFGVEPSSVCACLGSCPCQRGVRSVESKGQIAYGTGNILAGKGVDAYALRSTAVIYNQHLHLVRTFCSESELILVSRTGSNRCRSISGR